MFIITHFYSKLKVQREWPPGLHLCGEGDMDGLPLVYASRIRGALRVGAARGAELLEELGCADEKVEGRFRGVVLGLNENELCHCRQEAPDAPSQVFLPGGDEHHNGRILQVVGGVNEASVTVVSEVVDFSPGDSCLDKFAFEVERYGTAPAPAEDYVIGYLPKRTSLQEGPVVEAVAERGLRHVSVLF